MFAAPLAHPEGEYGGTTCREVRPVHIPTQLRVIMRSIRQRTGIEFRFHDLRRTAASHMTGIGISRLVVSKILNHAERDVTAVYDRHSYDPDKQEALLQWDKRVDQILRKATATGHNVVALVPRPVGKKGGTRRAKVS